MIPREVDIEHRKVKMVTPAQFLESFQSITK